MYQISRLIRISCNIVCSRYILALCHYIKKILLIVDRMQIISNTCMSTCDAHFSKHRSHTYHSFNTWNACWQILKL